MTLGQGATLQLVISAIVGAPYEPFSLPIRITFTNHGTAPIRILDHFEPLPVFFLFEVVGADGTPLIIPGGGKIDFGPNAPGYFELRPSDSRSIEVNVGRLLTSALQLGLYSVSVTYHNQYGDRCFRGSVKSNTIMVEVPAGHRGKP